MIGHQNLENNPSNSSPPPSSTIAKHKSRPKQKPKSPKVPEIDSHDVPVPAPDTGLTSVQPSVVRTGFLPIISSHPPTTLTIPPAAHTLGAGYSTLPVLATLTSRSATPTASVTVIPKDTSRTLGANQPNHATTNGPSHTQITVAVLVAVGIVFMFLSIFVYWKWCNRPRRRTCPTPSLPIFQDPFADQDLKIDEESLFGGKDNGSSIARPPSNGIYPWVQYTPRPSDTLAAGATKSPIPNLPSEELLAMSEAKLVSERSVAPVHIQLPVNASKQTQPVQQMQSALTRAAHRVSAMSMSIYPTSPQSNAGIGIAIGGASPLTGDGTPILTRKSSKERVSAKARQSFRHSLAANEYLDIYGEALASPTQPPRAAAGPIKSVLRKSPLAPPPGRARIQAGYTPGAANAALRASSTVAGITTLPRTAGTPTSFLAPSEEVQYVLPPLSPALKSDARRERDNRALTSALGLATPSPPTHESFMPSPVTTLHPDDSITLAGARDRDRDRDRHAHAHPMPDRNPTRTGNPSRAAHARTQSEAPMSPGMEASARLGNLMLAEFTNSVASLPSARAVVAPSASVPAHSKTSASARPGPRKTVNANASAGVHRMNDRPPRVPSPPPLPSLAQMAMAHTNPQGYEDYRSPTYSIYGLYEGKRQSRVLGALEDGSI